MQTVDAWLWPVIRSLVSPEAALSLTGAEPGRLWETAVAQGMTTDEEILSLLARQSRTSIASSLASSLPARARIPERLARRYCALPLSVVSDHIDVAVSNPFDLNCEAAFGFASGKRVRMSLAAPARIAERIHEEYSDTGSIDSLLALLSAGVTAGDTDAYDAVTDVHAPIVRLVDHIIAGGVAARASDIHVEREGDAIAVRYRVDGVLRPAFVLPHHVGLALVSRVKIMARMDIADRLRPQGGRASTVLAGGAIDLRVSTLPAAHGEKLVIRILDPRGGARSLDALGLDTSDLRSLRQLLETREGLVLVTGPTGSGKTTTLYAALHELQTRGLNIVTVEDPVEYRIPGIVQSQVNEKAGLTFAAALRSILRQDPDVILIGEVRDTETAAIAIQAALTGHLVFATLHTIDAASSIARLSDLGVDPAKVAVALKGVIAQRLLRRTCDDCAVQSDEPLPSSLWSCIPTGATLRRGQGCSACNGSGYRGRVPAIELIVPSGHISRLIATGAEAERVAAAARAAGSRSLWSGAIAHLLAGATTPDEISRVVDPDPIDDSNDTSAVDNHSYFTDDMRERQDQRKQRQDQMTELRIGVVDVYVIDPHGPEWRVLALRRSESTRCPGAWEAVHGHIQDGELPEKAAVRELHEETGLTPERLYNVTVHSFYLHKLNTVELAVVFCAFVRASNSVVLGNEHAEFAWLRLGDAAERFIWPRATQALREIRKLLGSGTAGPAEDVLRVI